MKTTKEKRQEHLRLMFTLGFIVLFTMSGLAQSATLSHLSSVATTIKLIVNAVLGILCLIKVGQVVYKAFFAHREFGADLGMALVGIVIWALFVIFGNDLLGAMGSSATIP